MKRFTLLCLTLLTFAWLQGQESEFSDEKWTHIEQRWNQSQPVVIVYTRSDGVISGQQIHATPDSLFILQDKGLPVGPDWQKGLVSVYVNEIDHVLFQAGGNKLWRKKKAAALKFPSSNPAYSEPHMRLRNSSVYVDTLYNPPDLNEAFVHSDVLRRAFRKKRFRYSFGVSFGSNVVGEEIQKAIDQTALPHSYGNWGEYTNMEILDLSVRFFDRLILGASLFSRRSSTYISDYSYNEIREMNYDYMVEYVENRIYAEYAILNIDRYFYRKFEVIAGAGLLLAKPEWRLSYSYYDVQNPDYEADPNLYLINSDKLLGL
ncbi:MAG: hypothetical protein ABFS28_12535, partial [Bacteroidota bacterium]